MTRASSCAARCSRPSAGSARAAGAALTLADAVSRALDASHRLAKRGRAKRARRPRCRCGRRRRGRRSRSPAATRGPITSTPFGFPQPDRPRSSVHLSRRAGQLLHARRRCSGPSTRPAGSTRSSARRQPRPGRRRRPRHGARRPALRSGPRLLGAGDGTRGRPRARGVAGARRRARARRRASGSTSAWCRRATSRSSRRSARSEDCSSSKPRTCCESSLDDLRRLTGAARTTPIEMADPARRAVSPVAHCRGRATAAGLATRLGRSGPSCERSDASLRTERRRGSECGGRGSQADGRARRLASITRNPTRRSSRARTSGRRRGTSAVNVSWPFVGRRPDRERKRPRPPPRPAPSRERLASSTPSIAADVRQRHARSRLGQAAVVAAEDGVRSAPEARRVRRRAVRRRRRDQHRRARRAGSAAAGGARSRTRALASVRLAEARLERALGRP